jgi:thiol-disulfide isomerase/thioredoxin
VRGALVPALGLVLYLATGCAGGTAVAKVGAALPSFTLEDLSGETVRSTDFEGSPTVISVWATWCQPCLKEIPLLQQLHADPRFRVVTIALDETGADTVAPFVEERGLTYPVLLGDQETFQSLGGFAIPHNVLVTADGTVADIIRGLLDEERVEALLLSS